MAREIGPVGQISVGVIDSIAIDMTPWLDSGELVDSVSVAEVTTADLSLSGAGTNAAEMVIDHKTVAVGKAALCQMDASGATAGATYRVRFTITSDASPARVEVRDYVMECVD